MSKCVPLLCQILFSFFSVISAAEPNTSKAPEILLGMSTALTGPAAELGRDMQRGVLAGLARANREGGFNGRKLRLIALDDGYEPARAAPNMRQLLEKDSVFAVIGNVGTPTAIVAIPIALERKTLLFAAFSGAGALRNNPPDRYVINYRASYVEEVGAMIDALINNYGLKPEDIALFTQRDGYGDAGFIGSMAALKRHGLKNENAVLHMRYERNTLAVENAVARLVIARHPPRAVVMVGAYLPCAKFIKLCCEAECKTLFLNVSFVGSNPLAKELGKINAPVVVTQVVPFPGDDSLPIVAEYKADLRAIDPDATPGFGDLEGYIAARIFTTGLSRIKDGPSRENIVDALEDLGDFDLGLGSKLRLSSTEHQASHSVWPTMLKDGAFIPLRWSDLPAQMKQYDVR